MGNLGYRKVIRDKEINTMIRKYENKKRNKQLIKRILLKKLAEIEKKMDTAETHIININ